MDFTLTGTPVNEPEYDFPDTQTRDAAYQHLADMRSAYEREAVVLSRGELHGPVGGTLFLPDTRAAMLGVLPGTGVDLDDDSVKVRAYEKALSDGDREAIASVVNPEEFVRLWPRLQLRTSVRQAWAAAWQGSGPDPAEGR